MGGNSLYYNDKLKIEMFNEIKGQVRKLFNNYNNFFVIDGNQPIM